MPWHSPGGNPWPIAFDRLSSTRRIGVNWSRLQRSPGAPAGLSRRARAVLLMAQDVPGVKIAERTGYTVVQVSRLRRRFAEHGVAGLRDRPRSGRPPTITARTRAQIVALTLRAPAPGVT